MNFGSARPVVVVVVVVDGVDVVDDDGVAGWGVAPGVVAAVGVGGVAPGVVGCPTCPLSVAID